MGKFRDLVEGTNDHILETIVEKFNTVMAKEFRKVSGKYHGLFGSVKGRKFKKVKYNDNSVRFEVEIGANINRIPIIDKESLMNIIVYEISELVPDGSKIYFNISYDGPNTDRQGRISSGCPVYFNISSSGTPYGDGNYNLAKFSVDGSGENRVSILNDIKRKVPKESKNGYVALRRVDDGGDKFIIYISISKAYMHYKLDGDPTSEYDNKVLSAIDEYESISQELSKQYNQNIIIAQ